jgi:hypothetical protein
MYRENNRSAQLANLEQAAYVLEQLAQGRMPPQNVDTFDSDNQLLKIWIKFLLDIKWIVRDNIDMKGYTVTEKGRLWLANLAAQKSPLPLST